MLCVVKPIHTKTVPTKRKVNQSAQIVGNYKDQAFRQQVVQNKFLRLHTYTSFTTTSQQHIQFYCRANCLPGHKMVIQIAQPLLFTKNLPEKQVQAKSDLSKQIAETAKKCLGVNIEGKDVFESIISRPAPLPLLPLFLAPR